VPWGEEGGEEIEVGEALKAEVEEAEVEEAHLELGLEMLLVLKGGGWNQLLILPSHRVPTARGRSTFEAAA
jgi:hypothetical protein